MKDTIIFAYPEDQILASNIAEQLDIAQGQVIFRRFPDEESYVRIVENIQHKNVILVCSLNQPDTKLLSLVFFANIAKNCGATQVGLITPYLAYMRQDTQFQSGESFSSKYFAALLSEYFDWLVTVDPHLHRHHSLNEIYTIPTKVLHAGKVVSHWIQENIQQPLIIGPDVESQQWVAEVAETAKAPYLVLQKERHSDRAVTISVPDVEKYQQYTPVLVDDIISTGHTMIETVKHLHDAEMAPVVCIGIHAIFSGTAYQDLNQAHVEKIVTCNTITHVSNAIDISSLFSKKLLELLSQDE